jgi:cyclopropane-fatty-acyl-phospholipid synthase
MQYSCALFAEGDDLASAQQRKLDWMCERLRLRPGLRLLDIGCGWGGLARYAAHHYECEVVGITISQEQFRYAQRWCRGFNVEIQLRDYREVSGQFDRVVSVGMVEHVGYKNYRTYMRAAARSLSEDGLFLCQGICGNVSRVHADPWIERYIFPNSMLPSLARVTRAAEGVFIIEDVKNIGPNYDPTLLAWEENFRHAWPRFADRYGERFRRMWRFYLLSCAGAFRARSLHVITADGSSRAEPTPLSSLARCNLEYGGTSFSKRGSFRSSSNIGSSGTNARVSGELAEAQAPSFIKQELARFPDDQRFIYYKHVVVSVMQFDDSRVLHA